MHTKLIHQVNLLVSEVNQTLVSSLRLNVYKINKSGAHHVQLFLKEHRYSSFERYFCIRVDHGTEPAERVPEGSDLCDFIIPE